MWLRAKKRAVAFMAAAEMREGGEEPWDVVRRRGVVRNEINN